MVTTISAFCAIVIWQDNSFGDDISWSARAVELPTGTQYRSINSDQYYDTVFVGKYAGYGSKGCYSTPYLPSEPGMVPVLTGFQFYFMGGDHHIDQIRVHVKQEYTSSGYRPVVDVCFNDENNDDGFTYFVSYALVPEGVLNWRTEGWWCKDTKSYTVPSGTAPVLQDFDFNFNDKDHHIDKILVDLQTTTGIIEVKFQDKNYDDRLQMDCLVQYTFIES